jgi:hypothetical protein
MMALSQEEVHLLFEVVGFYAAACGFMFYAFGWLMLKVLDVLIDYVRKRGASAPFAARAAYAERHYERCARAFGRIAERNRREAARRG